MVDIHCHIVPEVDDGAYNMEAAVEMVRIAASCGVKAIIATPHFVGRPESLAELGDMMLQFRRLQNAVKREKLELALYPGVEVLCLPQTLELAREGRLPTLGNSRYVLTEFYFDASWEFMDATLDTLQGFGYQPVVAHPERYGAVQRNLDLVRSWFERGIVIQVNKGSVLGAFGRRAEEAAVRLLYRGLVHVIASDAHSPEIRTTDLEPARQWCLDHVGREYTKILLEINPGRIVRGKPMHRVRREQ